MWTELEPDYHVWQSNNLNVTVKLLGRREGTDRGNYSVSVSCPELHPRYKDYGTFGTLDEAKGYALDFAKKVLSANVAQLNIALEGLKIDEKETKIYGTGTT